MTRLIIVDASVNKRVATELKRRGREAISAAELGVDTLLDDNLLQTLSERSDEWVLYTSDDRMPETHAQTIARLEPTIATLDPRRPSGQSEDQWASDVAHRWAHVIQRQAPGSVRRYNFARGQPWTPRRRRKP